MYFKNHAFRTFYRLVVLCVCQFSLTLQFMNIASVGGLKRVLCYFTPLVYTLGFLYFFYLICSQKGKEHPMLKGAVLVSIFAAGLAVPFLRDSGFFISVGTPHYGLFATKTLEFIAYALFPILALFDYLLFVPKGQYKALYPLGGLLFPAGYGLFLFLRATFGKLHFYYNDVKSAYPYAFLDSKISGQNTVILSVVGIFVGLLALGYLFYLLDWSLGKLRGKRK